MWSNLTDDGARLVLAAAFAYESADYGTTPATVDSARTLLAAPTLDCGGDVELTVRLFFLTLSDADAGRGRDGPRLQTVVWRNDPEVPNHVGNHVQLFATGVGVNLLVDPTIGLVAHGDLLSHLKGVPVPAREIVYPLSRKAPTTNGAFIRSVIHSIDGTEPAPYAGGRFLVSVTTPRSAPGGVESAWEVSVRSGDWVDRIALDHEGAAYILTRRGALLRVDAHGLHTALSAVRDIARGPKGAGVFALTRDGQVVAVAPDGVAKIVFAQRAVQVAAAGERTYVLTASNDLLEHAAGDAFTLMRHGIRSMASGQDGGALYVLTEDGTFKEFEAQGADTVLAEGVHGLASLRYGEFVAYWTDAGALVAVDRAGKRSAPLLSDVRDALIAPGDWTLDILQNSGVPCRADVDGRSGTLVPATSINFDPRVPMCGDPQSPSGRMAERIEHISVAEGALELRATTAAGATIEALAATW